MTDKGTTSPMTERSNISQMGQLATAIQSTTEQATIEQEAAPDAATSGAQTGADALDQVTVKMPADGAYLSVLRTATAGLAARLDFTLDEIEDMRIAVDEACA